MKAVIGVILIVLAVATFFYLGIWWAFIGGIVDAVEAFKAPEISALAVAIAAAKIIFFELIGGVPAYVLGLIGWTVMHW